AVAQEEVEGPVPRDPSAHVGDGLPECATVRGKIAKRRPQGFQKMAEGAFAVGLADGTVQPQRELSCVLEGAVAGEHPGTAPELPDEGMGVGHPDVSTGALADVR